ncbi:hypothetical protein [uncultured Microscilla sp.]|uniref:hypothetical protein n=1 Tax=uncultured Microscilla sp. TaxID=432653 RepID=UPI002610D34E|nr:hypothetical protein [uncultured Microscilla sp.]
MATVVHAQKLKKTKVNDNITIKLPENFIVMSDREYQQEFAGYRKPIAMYRSNVGKATFGINTALTHAPAGTRQTFVDSKGKMRKHQAEWSLNDLKMMKSLYKSTILRLHDGVRFKQDKIQTIRKRNFVVFEFVGVVKAEKKKLVGKAKGILRQYSYLMYTVKEGKIYIFNFSCPAKELREWKSSVYKMMKSIRVK